MSNLTFRTNPPQGFNTPAAADMDAVAGEIGLSNFDKSLAADLCHLTDGGAIVPPSQYRRAVAGQAEADLVAPDRNGKWSLSNGQSTTRRGEAVADGAKVAMQRHQALADFAQAVDLNRFPGESTMEKSMAVLKLLSLQKDEQQKLEKRERPEDVADMLHEHMDAVQALSDAEREMIDPDGKWEETEAGGVGGGDMAGEEKSPQPLSALKAAEDLVEGSEARTILDISRHLDDFAKLQVRKQKRLEADPAGEEVRQRPIKGLGELSRVSPSAWAMRQASPTMFLYQAVSGQLPVRERVTRQERKQAIFVLIDGSGSMSGSKHWKATGVVMNRLKAVQSGDAVVWVSVFDTQMKEPDIADSPESATELMKKFREGNFTGGSTDIAASVKAAHEFIEEQMKAGAALYRPEVVVLTDEDDSAKGLRAKQIPGTRVHGFAMEKKNPPLMALAKATGGVGIENF